jgi:DNA-binding beta-propeller fold protein YncE
LINTRHRRVGTPVQQAVTKPSVAKAPAAKAPAAHTPKAAPAHPFHAQDRMEFARPHLMDLSGHGRAPSAVASSHAHPAPKHSGGAERAGPKLLHLSQGWTPQGQGYDARRGEVLTTYYKGHDVMLSVQNKDSGKETQQARLGGKGSVRGPSHGGGVSTDGKNVYVSDTKNIYVYSRAEVERAAKEHTPAQPSQVMAVPNPKDLKDPKTGMGLVSAGSFMAVKDGYAYIGGYSREGDGKAGAVWRYKLDDKTGSLLKDSRQGPIRAPDRAQGVTVVDGALLFTTGDKKLVYQPIKSTQDTFQADVKKRKDISNGRLDPYAQGLNVVGKELWVTYESGSAKYRDKVDKPRESIQRIPLEKLDLKAAHLRPEQLEG